MDAALPDAAPPDTALADAALPPRSETTRALIGRLWREHIRHHRRGCC